MRIDFKDKSFVSFEHSSSPGKIIISLGAKSFKNPLETVVNSAEISINEFNDLVNDIKKYFKNVESSD